MGCSSSTEVRAVSPTTNNTSTSRVHHQPHLQQFQQQQHYESQPQNHKQENHESQRQDSQPKHNENQQQQILVSHNAQNQNKDPAPATQPQNQLTNTEKIQNSNGLTEANEKNDKVQSKPFLKYTAPSQSLNVNSGLAVDMEDYKDLDSRIANSNAILSKEESIENTKARLASYGDFKESYNIRELSEHNAEKEYLELFSFHGDVVSMPALFDICSPYILAIERTRLLENEPDLPESEYFTSEFHHWFESPYPVPFASLLHDGLDSKTISLCMRKCRVSTLRTGKKEEAEDLKIDANVLLEEISQNIQEPTQNQIEYKDQLQRACKRFEITLASQGETEERRTSGDPNEQTFPLPDVFLKNPKFIRQWIENWQTMDTAVGPGDGWNFSLKQWEVFEKGSDEMKIDDTKLHRTELDNEPALDLSIDGEAGWEVIPVDIVKNDVTTAQQEETWKARENRKDLNDPERMAKRRLAIEAYFKKKYETQFSWASQRVEEFRDFADNLVKAEKEFQVLCEES
ncbi:uncharacterized protein LOC134236453 [Saccostrea cucullata]|uniref:uncharacterized protein LOC134236453 n=1 Tax=Saccostrea cuccullata TaxID=36930 RepID=UPI002ED4A908